LVRIDKDLVAASATPLVLGILAEGESYGYAILKKVNELSAGEMRWTDGMLYPLLHRLERLGYIQASWRMAASGRRRKHYAITQAGLELFADRRRQWAVVTDALKRVWAEAAAAMRPARAMVAEASR
jgi:PadR family transcriptional regulator, regulatory protein PadR